MNVRDISGKTFGRLTVKEHNGPNKQGRAMWLCTCACGKEVVVSGTKLRVGEQRSCGCFRNEEAARRATKHGMSNTFAYSSWVAMMHRCYTPNRKGYSRYGGRGIKVCKRWHTFENFYADMGERPAGLTLERKDVNGDYKKSNCVWATRNQQGWNKQNSRYVRFGGAKKLMEVWADEYGLARSTLQWRLDAGWSVKRAITEPPRCGRG